MVINSMKVFDIVFVQPANAEANGTVVIAERMIRWFFLNGHDGRGAAIAVILFVAVIPVMIWNVQRFRQQEEEPMSISEPIAQPGVKSDAPPAQGVERRSHGRLVRAHLGRA